MRPVRTLLIAFLALCAAPVAAQLLPQLGVPQTGIPGVDDVLDDPLRPVDRITGDTVQQIERLAQERLERIDRFVRRNRDVIELDLGNQPARRGEIVLLDATEPQIAQALSAGYRMIERQDLGSLGMSYVRLALPEGTDLGEAQDLLGELLPDAQIAPDNLYFTAGSSVSDSPAQSGFGRAAPVARAATVGMIDGAPASSIPVTHIRGFAEGAGQASDHGSAIASLLRGTGVSDIKVADVYGTDRAGGNAIAIARALDWLVSENARVITISLVGPDNAVLRRAITAARGRGAVVVAAVGNDGPAAPPAYPASYAGVVSVTGVDRRNRALMEAGRALHLDYAAPGADVYGKDRRGRNQRLRGTSYATPLVAARIARALGEGRNWRAALDSEARDLGPRGPDDTYGRGLVCRGCGTRS